MERRKLNSNKKMIAVLALISLTVAIISEIYANSNEAENSDRQILNRGTAEPEFDPNGGELLGYDTTTKTVTETVDNYVWRY